jgi:chromosome segregation ATPase
LSHQLECMEPLLENLESSLSSSKSKLKQEQTLRRQAELAQVEMEARHQEAESNFISLRDDNEALRSECDAAHEETAFKCSELDESNEEKAKYAHELEKLKTRLGGAGNLMNIRRTVSGPDQSSSSATNTTGEYTSGVVSNRTPASSHMDESHLEILDELENVTEQFITTQQKLWKTEDSLRDSETKIRGLQTRLEMNEGGMDKGGDLPSDEARMLRDELNLLKEEYSVTADDLTAAEEEAEKYKSMLEKMKMQGSGQMQKFSQLEVAEAREENSYLKEEIACLRETLKDTAYSQTREMEVKETITKEVRATVMKEAKVEREREINVLREKFKKLFKENSILQEKVDKSQTECSEARGLNESSKYKEQIAKLSAAFKQAKEEHKSIVNELDTMWRKKVQEARDGKDLERNSFGGQLRTLSREKDSLKEKVDDFERALIRAKKESEKSMEQWSRSQLNLDASRDEVRNLKKQVEVLNLEVEYSNTACERAEHALGEGTPQTEGVKAREKTVVLLKENVSMLSDSLKKARKDYSELLDEVELSREQFLCDASQSVSQEEARTLKKKVDTLTAVLETTQEEVKQAELLRKELNEFKKENRKLKDNLNGSSSTSNTRGLELLMNFFDGNQREARDPDPLSDSEDRGDLENLEKLVTTRDPPSSSLPLTSTLTVSTEEREEGEDIVDLNSRLHLLSKENSMLKETIESLETSGDASSTEIETLKESLNKARDETVRLKKKVVSLNIALKTTLSTHPYEIDSLRPILKEACDDSAASDEDANLQPDLERSVVGDQFTDLHKENCVLHEKLEAAEKALNHLADRYCGKTEKMKVYEDGLKSSTTETSKLREKIASLQLALQAEKSGNSTEAEELEQSLYGAEARLAEMQRELANTKNKMNALESQISTLTASADEARQGYADMVEQLDQSRCQNEVIRRESESMAAAGREEEFKVLREQLKKITQEKAMHQHRVDDSKIALSVSEYAQERNKEELRTCETQLESAREELYTLKDALAGMKQERDNVFGELKSLNLQVKTTDGQSNKEIQQKIKKLENTLFACQRELRAKCDELMPMEQSVASSREETRLLTEEISHLSLAFENARSEYDSVVDELEAVNELFDEARQEAERCGREAAAQEFRVEMQAAREQERKLMKEQLRKIFDENAALQRRVDEAEMTVGAARRNQDTSNAKTGGRKEVTILKDALRSTTEESRTLKENMFNLSLALNHAKQELKATQDDLNLANDSVEAVRQQAEKDARASAIEQVRANSEKKEQDMLRDHLKNLIGDKETEPSQKAEGLKLKVELLDMSMSLEKALKENSLIEEELENFKKSMDQACAEAVKHGRFVATKEVRAETSLEREREMKEFKAQFNVLVEENATLQQKLKDAEISVAVVSESQDRTKEEIRKLESALMTSRSETRKFQEEVFNLSVELETANEDHERVLEEMKSDFKAEGDSKQKGLKHQLSALSIENKALQHKVRSAGIALASTKNSEDRREGQVEVLQSSLHNSQDTARKLQQQVSRLNAELGQSRSSSDEYRSLEKKLESAQSALSAAKSVNEEQEQELGGLNSQLSSSEEEALRLETRVSHLTESLEQTRRDLHATKQNFDNTRAESQLRIKAGENSEVAVFREQLNNLMNEKSVLQNQVDDAQISLSVSKYSEDRNKEELETCKTTLQSSKEESTRLKGELSKLNQELLKSKTEDSATLNELQTIDKILSQVKEVDTTLTSSETNFVSSAEKATEIKDKITRLTLVLLESKKERANISNELLTVKQRVDEIRVEAQAAGRDTAERDFREQKEKEMKALREQIKSFFTENSELEQKIEDTESALSLAKDAQEKYKLELELSRSKYDESQKEALNLKAEVTQWQAAHDGAKRDQTSLRSELDGVNRQVLQLCREAEERGKVSASTELRSGFKSIKDDDKKELIGQFRQFYEENTELQKRLDDKESALVAARDTEGKLKEQLKKIEEDAKTQSERGAAAADELEAVNRRLSLELDNSKQELDSAERNRDIVVKELELVKERLDEVREQASLKEREAANYEFQQVSTDRDVEMQRLQEEFKKLSSSSIALGQKVEDAEHAVSRAWEEREKTTSESQSRVVMATKLKAKLDRVTESRERRDLELDELASVLASRVCQAEDSVTKLEKEISLTKGSLQVSEAGLDSLRQNQEKLSSSPSRKMTDEGKTSSRFVETRAPILDDDFSYQSSDLITSESRDDLCVYPAHNIKSTRRSRSVSPVSRDSRSLHSRSDDIVTPSPLALEARTKIKKQTLKEVAMGLTRLRKFDRRHAKLRAAAKAHANNPFQNPNIKTLVSKTAPSRLVGRSAFDDTRGETQMIHETATKRNERE